MKLISLNVENFQYHKSVFPFLENENADVVCLQEATKENVAHLEKLGYHVTFLPRCLKIHNRTPFTDGHLIATRQPHVAKQHYYYDIGDELTIETYNTDTHRLSGKYGITMCTFEVENEMYNIATTHFTWAQNGDIASNPQKKDMVELLKYTDTLPAHILCGDFNIPRHYNNLYEELVSKYIDNIPKTYKHSLDPTHHKLNFIPEKKHLVQKYMVDYLFSKPSYKVENVRLEFGISDHAAIIGDVYKT